VMAAALPGAGHVVFSAEDRELVREAVGERPKPCAGEVRYVDTDGLLVPRCVSACPPDAFEPNDSAMTPAQLAPGTYHLSLCDDDVFAIAVAGTLHLEPPAGCAATLAIATATGWYEPPPATTGDIDAGVGAGAVVRIRAAAPCIAERSGYRLVVTAQPPAPS
jgi:hypothetical protein